MQAISTAIRLLLSGFFLISVSVSALVQADDALEPYKIQPGDVLEISVWHEPDLLRTVLVRPDGGISFPLVGDVQASGATVEELREVVTARVAKYIPDPVVTISMQALDGNKIYIIGKVQRPGEFPANRYLDVIQALSSAGGINPYASANKIKILRRENGKLVSIPFRYGDIEKGVNLEQNIILRSGDIILVP